MPNRAVMFPNSFQTGNNAIPSPFFKVENGKTKLLYGFSIAHMYRNARYFLYKSTSYKEKATKAGPDSAMQTAASAMQSEKTICRMTEEILQIVSEMAANAGKKSAGRRKRAGRLQTGESAVRPFCREDGGILRMRRGTEVFQRKTAAAAGDGSPGGAKIL